MFYFVIMISPTIPLVLPFGLLYFIVSIYTDRVLLVLIYKKGKKLNGYNIIRKSTYVLLFYLISYSFSQIQFFTLFFSTTYLSILLILTFFFVFGVLITCCVFCCIPRIRKIKRTKLEDGEFDEIYKQPFYDDFTRSK